MVYDAVSYTPPAQDAIVEMMVQWGAFDVPFLFDSGSEEIRNLWEQTMNILSADHCMLMRHPSAQDPLNVPIAGYARPERKREGVRGGWADRMVWIDE